MASLPQPMEADTPLPSPQTDEIKAARKKIGEIEEEVGKIKAGINALEVDDKSVRELRLLGVHVFGLTDQNRYNEEGQKLIAAKLANLEKEKENLQSTLASLQSTVASLEKVLNELLLEKERQITAEKQAAAQKASEASALSELKEMVAALGEDIQEVAKRSSEHSVQLSKLVREQLTAGETYKIRGYSLKRITERTSREEKTLVQLATAYLQHLEDKSLQLAMDLPVPNGIYSSVESLTRNASITAISIGAGYTEWVTEFTTPFKPFADEFTVQLEIGACLDYAIVPKRVKNHTAKNIYQNHPFVLVEVESNKKGAQLTQYQTELGLLCASKATSRARVFGISIHLQGKLFRSIRVSWVEEGTVFVNGVYHPSQFAAICEHILADRFQTETKTTTPENLSPTNRTTGLPSPLKR